MNTIQNKGPANLPALFPSTFESGDDIRNWLVQKVAELLAINEEEVDIQFPLVEYGLSSTQAVQIAGQLAERTGLSTPPTLLYDYPSILELSEYILAAQATSE